MEQELKVALAQITKLELLETANKKPYCNGNLVIYGEGTAKSLKIWEDAGALNLHKEITENNKQYFKIQYKDDSYNGTTYANIKAFQVMTEAEVESTFMKKIKEEQAHLIKVRDEILVNNVSEKGRKFLEDFINNNKEIWELFHIEQAAMGKHDATPVGLLRHTVKMLKFLELTLDLSNNFYLNEDGKDLLFLGLLLHDIGKVREYDNGKASQWYKVTHRGLGIEIIVENKELFLKYFDQDFYYETIAIINQHHGIYEEKPHSFFSYFVHLVDMFDTHTTGLYESLYANKDNKNMRALDRDIPVLEKEPKYFNF